MESVQFIKRVCILKRDSIVMKSFKKGLLLVGCGESTIRFAPPLIISKKDIDVVVEILEKVFKGK